ncbi:MAG: RodZ domain-containing protein [Pseudomonadota bacterium]
MSEVGTNLLPEQLNTSEPVPETIPVATASVDRPVDSSAGGQLAAARLQKNLSVQQVADQLKLSPRQIAALEANQFDALPKAVIVRGFVRSYAKLLRIDAEPIVALLPQDAVPAGAQVTALRPAMATPFLESRLPLMGRQDANNHKYIWGAGLLAILAIGFFAFQRFEHTDYLKNLLPGNTATSAASSASAEALAEPASMPAMDERASTVPAVPATQDSAGNAAGKTADTDVVVGKPDADKKVAEITAPASNASAASPLVVSPVASAPTAPSTVKPVTTPASSAQLAQLAAAPASQNMALAAPAAAKPAVIDPANAMKLKFRQDSWIQIKRANGTIVTSHLAKAGTEETFEVKEPLQLRVGNAAGVDGLLRGAPLDIQASKDSNVVNLNVK